MFINVTTSYVGTYNKAKLTFNTQMVSYYYFKLPMKWNNYWFYYDGFFLVCIRDGYQQPGSGVWKHSTLSKANVAALIYFLEIFNYWFVVKENSNGKHLKCTTQLSFICFILVLKPIIFENFKDLINKKKCNYCKNIYIQILWIWHTFKSTLTNFQSCIY